MIDVYALVWEKEKQGYKFKVPNDTYIPALGALIRYKVNSSSLISYSLSPIPFVDSYAPLKVSAKETRDARDYHIYGEC